MRPILIVPGYRNSEPEHWQSWLESRSAGARRVQMPCFERPGRAGWIASLERAIAACEVPPVLVAHSLGCIAVAHWAQQATHPIHGALLVAPCDVERHGLPSTLCDFAPLPLAPLEFPTTLVVSTDDPYLDLTRAGEIAFAWGVRPHVIEQGGHLNTLAGYGPWPEAAELLDALL